MVGPDRSRRRVDGVEQRRCGELGGRGGADHGAEPRLDQSGHRGLGDHEDAH
jgi:hypothetical protein